jgi:hypothetical protein
LLGDAGLLAGRRRRGIGNGNLSNAWESKNSGGADQQNKIAQRRKETTERLNG